MDNAPSPLLWHNFHAEKSPTRPAASIAGTTAPADMLQPYSYCFNFNNVDIQIKKDLRLSLYGVSGVAVNRDWAAAGMSLMNKMWGQVKLDRQRINHRLPYLEIYGHWTEDTSRLETELCWRI